MKLIDILSAMWFFLFPLFCLISFESNSMNARCKAYEYVCFVVCCASDKRKMAESKQLCVVFFFSSSSSLLHYIRFNDGRRSTVSVFCDCANVCFISHGVVCSMFICVYELSNVMFEWTAVHTAMSAFNANCCCGSHWNAWFDWRSSKSHFAHVALAPSSGVGGGWLSIGLCVFSQIRRSLHKYSFFRFFFYLLWLSWQLWAILLILI